jgi:hypothetical protein
VAVAAFLEEVVVPGTASSCNNQSQRAGEAGAQ